jgi:hypothetical protein
MKVLPRFALSTPIPYTRAQLFSLHSRNLATIDAFLARNQLSVPDQISDFSLHPRQPPISLDDLPFTLKQSSPWKQLLSYLHNNNLLLTPADKTCHLVIWPVSTYLAEFKIHISDKDTYYPITQLEADTIHTTIISLLDRASKFFKDPYLFHPSTTPRYFFLLPKIHKPLNNWRIPYLHPKCRPIISDSPSSTRRLSKKLLIYTQRLENTLSTVTNSSIIIASTFEHNITMSSHFSSLFNSTYGNHLTLTTFDVESLFTRIPLNRLYTILELHLPHVCHSHTESSTILQFLHTIIHNNTFFAGGIYYHQRTGLPMGNALSGSLANIYLGFLEKEIIHRSPSLLYYQRYMDDAFFVTLNHPYLIQTFLSQLQETFQLTLTANSSPTHICFLDLRIHIIPPIFDTTFYSKSSQLFRLPLLEDRRPAHINQRLLKSQLLRMWRLSTNDIHFSTNILNIIQETTTTGISKLLTSTIFQFLKPVQIHRKKWSTSHIICDICLSICLRRNIIVRKIFHHFQHFISSKIPISCHTTDTTFIIFQPPLNLYLLTTPTSLHLLLSRNTTPFIHILPYTNKLLNKDDPIFKRFPFRSTFLIPPQTNPYTNSLYLHPTVKNFKTIYGIPAKMKKRRTVANFFNQYKRILLSTQSFQ